MPESQGQDAGGVPAPTCVEPSVAGSEQRLDPRWVAVERLTGGIAAAVVSLGLLIGMLFTLFLAPLAWMVQLALPVAWFLLSAAIGVTAWAWPPIAYRYTSYGVSERELRIRRGALWRSIVSVPRSRIQHTDVTQGPIERMFELSTLVVYTAGTEHASVSLPGLARATALSIRDHLLAGAAEDDAV